MSDRRALPAGMTPRLLSRAIDPKPGESVRFKWCGAWVRGTVLGEGTKLRLPLRRDDGPPSKRVYWRNRTQIFRAAQAPA